MESRAGIKRGWASGLAAACALLVCLACGAPSASAVVVHTPGGHFLGIIPHRGITAASIPGSVAAQNKANLSSNGNLAYHSGPVVHSSAPYLIFWAPTGFSIQASSQALLERYFGDVAADSGKSSNIYGVDRQFTDASGFADYRQTFSASSQSIADTQAYPAINSGQCRESIAGEGWCITDAQIEAELQRLITAKSLPDDGSTSSSALPANAPVYFVVLPSNVNVCDASNSCADTIFCAYHSSFTDTAGHNVLYSPVPFLAAARFAKGCQADGNSVVQQPNGDIADVALKFLSHEDSEVLTDPLGSAWYDSNSGNEDGDNCNAFGSSNPQSGTSPNAFGPALGGSAGAGTLYDQLISGDPYYVQSEWSNGDTACQMAPSRGTITPSFTQPAGPNPVGTPVRFDPSASTSTNPYTSATWSFGDGGTTFKVGSGTPGSVLHTYSSAGNYTVTLTLVDDRGNLAKTTRAVTIGMPPSAAFSSSPSHPLEGTPVSFDASASSDPDSGVRLTSYAWDFGDGSTSTTTTPVTNHTYAHYGTYAVRLTVTNSIGLTSAVSHQVTVIDEQPTASFANQVPSPTVGQSVPFDGSPSNDPDGSIVSYAWDFGDGASGSGATTSHAYTTTGTYTITLTVMDSDGQTASTQHQVTVVVGPIASFTFSPPQPVERTAVSFDGTGSSDPQQGVTITSYSWSFGDGATATGATTTHTYAHYGTYLVQLTVTNSNGQSDTAPQTVKVTEQPPTAAFRVTTSLPATGQPVSFDGSSSSDPDGPIVSYAWSFGDGGTGTGATPSHTYSSYGTYTVTLTVSNANGQTDSISHQVLVHATPAAAFTYSPPRPLAGTSVSFDATGSSNQEPGVTITSYTWDFGDGSHASGAMVAHAFAAPGDYPVTVTVTNSLGLSSTNTHVVVVLDLPTASFSITSSVPTAGQAVAFDASSSSDPDAQIVSYAWTFGDGGTGTGVTPSHTYSSYGTYTATLTVTDANGLSATVSHQVVVHAPPALSFSYSPSRPLQRTAVAFDATASSEPEPGATIASYSWSFGDGSSASGPKAVHAYAQPGTYTVTLTATSSLGASASTTQSVTVADQQPVPAIVVTTARPLSGQPVHFDASHSSDPADPIVSYAWHFGDGGVATGIRPSHVYRRSGSYRVVLTVTDGFGQSATAVTVIKVALAGRITGLSLRGAHGGATLLISVNSPGVVSAGHRSIRLRRAGTVRLQIRLTRGQVRRLAGQASVSVHVALRFSPQLGPASRKALTITFMAPVAPTHRLHATLQP